ncbi:MAG: hypothetical protein ACI85O_000923 [Saprospiraceae bacterium]|jgi:hypothetical protein
MNNTNERVKFKENRKGRRGILQKRDKQTVISR